MSYSFWCSGCKVSHAGECPPPKAPERPKHKWVGDPIVDLSLPFHCERCGTQVSVPVIQALNKQKLEAILAMQSDCMTDDELKQLYLKMKIAMAKTP